MFLRPIAVCALDPIADFAFDPIADCALDAKPDFDADPRADCAFEANPDLALVRNESVGIWLPTNLRCSLPSSRELRPGQ